MHTTKTVSLRHHQLQIEFPDEHMRKYWLDNNVVETPTGSKFCLEGRMRAYRKERGWHYTTKNKIYDHERGVQFPVELHWVWYDSESHHSSAGQSS